jgi:hypothetical protein
MQQRSFGLMTLNSVFGLGRKSNPSVVLSAAKDLITAGSERTSELLAMRSFAALRMTKGYPTPAGA